MKKVLFTGAICIIYCISVFSQSKKTWEKTQSVNSISAYEDLLKNYPDGKYALSAKEAIKRLKVEQEADDWKHAYYQLKTISAYKDFILKYPNSEYLSKAKEELKNLEEEQAFIFEVENDIKSAGSANDTIFKKITMENYSQMFSHQKETLYSWITNLVISKGYIIAPGCTATLFIDKNEEPLLCEVQYTKADYINGKIIPKGEINDPIRIIHKSPFMNYVCFSYNNGKTTWERLLRKSANIDKIISNTVVWKDGFYYLK